ncbi:MAG: DNA polymerase Y family protein [Gemmatimonadota bacterium]
MVEGPSRRHVVPTHPYGRGWDAPPPGTSSTSPASPCPGSAPPPSARGSRQALCLWLPTFELRLELVRTPELDTTSVALLSPARDTRRTVWQVSERAHESGVRPGQLVSQALSLCPSLTLLEPDPAHYESANEAILQTLLDLTPVVEPADRGCFYLGMDGLERLFGPPRRQIERALGALFRVLPPPLVAATRAGRAPGKFGAWVAATAARPGAPVLVTEDRLAAFLARCPVGVLPVDPLVVQRLERLGVETLGALLRLPEPSLIAQFGAQGRDALAWASGRRIDPVRPLHRPRPIRVSLDFPAPAGTAETLHGALRHLVEQALARPARRGRSVRGARLSAHLEGGSSWSVDAVFREPTADAARIAFALRNRMALSPPSRAVETLILEFTHFGAPATQTTLFDRGTREGRTGFSLSVKDGEVPAKLRDAIRELKLRIGHSPLYRVVEMDPWSRIPERRHALLNFDP